MKQRYPFEFRPQTGMLHETLSPYLQRYPVKYRVEYAEKGRHHCSVHILTDSPRPYWRKIEQSDEDDTYHLIVDAFRGLYNTYGDILFFSNPEAATSWVYRSEREFLEDYDQRFSWSCHAYHPHSYTDPSEATPERYIGLLFLRPWQIHRDTQPTDADKNYAEEHDMVAPAICEAYLRPPSHFSFAPFFSLCLGNYAHPYSVYPFDCIPIYAARFGADCGHSMLTTALAMSRSGAAYSPYEIAVYGVQAYASLLAPSELPTRSVIGPKDIMFHEISGLEMADIPAMVNKRALFDGIAINECVATKKGLTTKAHERELAHTICTYLEQGLPVLYSVDHKALYSPDSSITMTDETEQHMILIHGILLPRNNTNKLPSFVFSDGTDLHLHGGPFNVASCKRLLDSRVREGSSPGIERMKKDAGVSPGISKLTKKKLDTKVLSASLTICSPYPLRCGYQDIRRRLRNELGKDFESVYPVCYMSNRTCLFPHLAQLVFPGFFDDISQYQGLEQRFRQYLRFIDLPHFLWIASKSAGPKCDGLILHGSSEERFWLGGFSVPDRYIAFNTLDQQRQVTVRIDTDNASYVKYEPRSVEIPPSC